MDAAAMGEFGISLEVGEEYRMGWYEHTFVFVPPVAGIRRVRTGNGTASFTPANRCVAISDGFQLVILDRRKDHGVRLAIPPKHWFEATLDGSTVVIRCYEAHGGRKLMDLHELEAHVDDNHDLVPRGWRWERRLLPG